MINSVLEIQQRGVLIDVGMTHRFSKYPTGKLALKHAPGLYCSRILGYLICKTLQRKNYH